MKVEIAQLTLFLLTVVAALFILGILVLVMCAGLRINPFREKTTSFLLAVFSGLIGLAVILVLLNVATNISLIADAKIAQLGMPADVPYCVNPMGASFSWYGNLDRNHDFCRHVFFKKEIAAHRSLASRRRLERK